MKNKRQFPISVDACVSPSLSCPPSNNELNSHPECFSELCLHIHHLLEGVPKHRAASLLGNRHQIPRSSSSTRFPLPRPTPHFTRLGSVKSDLGNEKCHLHSLGNPSSVRLEFLMSRPNLAAGRCRPISHFTSGAFMLMLRFSGGGVIGGSWCEGVGGCECVSWTPLITTHTGLKSNSVFPQCTACVRRNS